MDSLNELTLNYIVKFFVDVSVNIIAKETWKPNSEGKVNQIIEEIKDYYEPCRIFLHRFYLYFDLFPRPQL